ncbi:hypothetical protein K7711_07555 [Nocardia sp. CA2R105]|uniref:hypothetical protein n=1 Tax=Nocardia coffeae TaxID=2873381 RepID=UPI001CA77D12|nr:hypothetical protein [Nocardia coffeae]MBY8856326.1 hypothetical protein [Nocardia coffeae]
MSRRYWARAVFAGAIVAVPLAALAVPAQAEPTAPHVTQVRHEHWNVPWDVPGTWDNWNRHGRWDDRYPYERRHHHHRGWQRSVPPGWFGSS